LVTELDTNRGRIYKSKTAALNSDGLRIMTEKKHLLAQEYSKFSTGMDFRCPYGDDRIRRGSARNI
jgi:hypothetical protein